MDYKLLENILNISRRMTATRELAPLLEYAMDEAIKLVGAERGFLVLSQPDGSLDFPIKRNVANGQARDTEDQVSRSIINQVLKTGEPLLLRDAMSDPTFDKAKSVMALKLRSIICVPLSASGERVGAIYVENRSIQGRFDDNDLTILILFANQAAVSIENARLNANLEMRVEARTKELKQAMLQVEKSWTEAIEANRLRMEWLNNFAHDLRTSLSVVSGSLTLLQTNKLGSLNDKQMKWINQSLSAVSHTVDLINDLLDLSKLDANGLTLSPQEVELSEFLPNVYEVGLRLPWPETVTLELDIPTQLPIVSFDPVRIRQVLFNLLSNAHKFTTRGQVTLQARYLASQDEILLGVADTGEGIPADKLNRLFERFQQVDDNTARLSLGSGLGLAICRELVEMHGGKIWVESTPGQGSNFMFTLPLKPPTPDAQSSS